MKEFVEKLVKRLENRMSYVNKCHEEFKDSKMAFTYEIKINAYKNAIEIVNQLAEECENDFCEWKWGNDYAQVQCMGDKILFGCRRLFTYCPYCGKKIKEIE